MGERVDITVSEKGSRRVTRNFFGIGTAASKAQSSVSLLKTSLLGIGVGLALRSTIRTIADFEQTMSSVQGVTAATADQMKDLTAVAQELGASTRFSATEAGEGLLFLARAGFTADEQLKTIGQTLNLAQSGGLDLGSCESRCHSIDEPKPKKRLNCGQTARLDYSNRNFRFQLYLCAKSCAIRPEDPWLSVPRLRGIWLYKQLLITCLARFLPPVFH